MADDDSIRDDAPDSPSNSLSFDRARHIRFLEMMYQLLPSPYQTQEINRITLAYFVITGLDILAALDRTDKEAMIHWVLSLQSHPKNEVELNNGQFYGFHGSRSSQYHLTDDGVHEQVAIPNGSHLASTYCALAILKTVGYDLSLVDSKSLLGSMRNLQQADGSFMPIHIGAETDLRFVFCAAAICSLLKNWSGMDREKAKNYIISCQSYDGGFGLIPGSESHETVSLWWIALKLCFPLPCIPCQGPFKCVTGGATYCAVAALRLMGFIDKEILSKNASSCTINVPLLIHWSLQRQAQDGGFQGRINKSADTCYAFWIGGVLRILGADKFIDEGGLRGFLLTCQSKYHLDLASMLQYWRVLFKEANSILRTIVC
ncbi:geranylgeranyl transferase type-1 subunit beta isoform X2 [Olea europaea var. sylvestris]|uniref:geranylgeranyl transferase type-1 subunit beta isoform X2 n=1 Tax=Olea europaea var. sylvestris TaxID=158386 RepID=UPI000C1CFF94|nr:geranylgeranyl transferase type-1 subunit beta isoform X2 [Olea europaea var. sylvestris]